MLLSDTAARLTERPVPWLCVPGSRRVCLYRSQQRPPLEATAGYPEALLPGRTCVVGVRNVSRQVTTAPHALGTTHRWMPSLFGAREGARFVNSRVTDGQLSRHGAAGQRS